MKKTFILNLITAESARLINYVTALLIRRESPLIPSLWLGACVLNDSSFSLLLEIDTAQGDAASSDTMTWSSKAAGSLIGTQTTAGEQRGVAAIWLCLHGNRISHRVTGSTKETDDLLNDCLHESQKQTETKKSGPGFIPVGSALDKEASAHSMSANCIKAPPPSAAGDVAFKSGRSSNLGCASRINNGASCARIFCLSVSFSLNG